MGARGLQDAVDELYGADFDAFVDERTRLAKELRAAGDRPGALELAKLRKPSAAVWAINHVARHAPDALDAWLSAVEALRDAAADPQGAGRDALRAAMRDHRDATQALLEVVGRRARPGNKDLSGAMLDRVRELLGAAAMEPGMVDAIRHGRLTEPDDEAAATTLPAAAPRERRKEEPKRAKQDARARRVAEGEQEGEKAAEAERRRQAEQRAVVEGARREAERRRAEATDMRQRAEDAERRLEEARQALNRRESEAGAATRAAEDAERAAEDAERKLERLQRR